MKMATTKPYILAATLSKAIANKNNIKTSSAAGKFTPKNPQNVFFSVGGGKKSKRWTNKGKNVVSAHHMIEIYIEVCTIYLFKPS